MATLVYFNFCKPKFRSLRNYLVWCTHRDFFWCTPEMKFWRRAWGGGWSKLSWYRNHIHSASRNFEGNISIYKLRSVLKKLSIKTILNGGRRGRTIGISNRWWNKTNYIFLHQFTAVSPLSVIEKLFERKRKQVDNDITEKCTKNSLFWRNFHAREFLCREISRPWYCSNSIQLIELCW